MRIVQAIDEAIGAEEKLVTDRIRYSANLWIHKLITASQSLLQHIASRMGSGLPLVDLAIAIQPTDVGVVFGELANAPGSRKMVNTAIAHMSKVQEPRCEPTQAQRGLHPTALLITATHVDQSRVDLPKKSLKQDARGDAFAGPAFGAESFGQNLRHLLDSHPAGKFPSLCAPHPVADREDKISRLQRRFPILAQPFQLLPVEPQTDKRILIVDAHFPAIGTTRPMQAKTGDFRIHSAHLGSHGA